MKRWEWFNKISGTNESIEIQAHQIVQAKYIEFPLPPSESQIESLIDAVFKFLSEEVEE